MSPKLVMLFILIGVIIGLSHVNDVTTARMNPSARWSMIAQSMFRLSSSIAPTQPSTSSVFDQLANTAAPICGLISLTNGELP